MPFKISSFDIFDTCVVRKCGGAHNLFDVLSYRVFSGNVSDELRMEFVAQRLQADDTTTLEHLYDTFNYRHPLLKKKQDLMRAELECEHEMMVAVFSTLQIVKECRNKGSRIIFISDMYLPVDFLRERLSNLGFYREGDALYVSGYCGYKKTDGSLYEWIKEQENLKYEDWQHFGDNLISDVKQPSKLGIKTHQIKLKYLPYEESWCTGYNNPKYNISGIMAGLGRSIFHSIKFHPHNSFAIDIAAPLLVTFALRIMTDAAKRGIRSLFFSSRDCYVLYHVAKILRKVVPTVDVNYFYTSREALYNTSRDELVRYLLHIGVANAEGQVGIVDMRSTGKSLKYLNDILIENGFQPAFGYYFEMYCSNFYIEDVPPYYCEINRMCCSLLAHHHPIIETFLSLCPDGRTIGYNNNRPIQEKQNCREDCFVEDIEELSHLNLSIVEGYTEGFIETKLFHYINDIFTLIIIPTLDNFIKKPHKVYLQSLGNLLLLQSDGSYLPYVKKVKNGFLLRIETFVEIVPNKIMRNLLNLLMRWCKIKPLSKIVWWPEGTISYNRL